MKNQPTNKLNYVNSVTDILPILTTLIIFGAFPMVTPVQAETATKNAEVEKNTPGTSGTQNGSGREGQIAPQSSTKNPEAEQRAPDTTGTGTSQGTSGNLAPQTSTKNKEVEGMTKDTTSGDKTSTQAMKEPELLSDQDFLMKASQGGMTEVKLGELAQKQGRSDIRDIGKMMVKDHTKINSDLKSVAAKSNMTLSKDLDDAHQAKVDKLNKLSGVAFDQAYLDAMGTAHTKDLAMFKAQRATTSNMALKDSLDKAILVVESHISHLSKVKSI